MHLSKSHPSPQTEEKITKIPRFLQDSPSALVQRLLGDYFVTAPKTRKKAMDHYRKAATMGDSHSKFVLASLLFSENEKPKALHESRALYLELSEGGNAEAAYRSAVMCLRGVGGTKDFETAHSLLLQAALAQHPAAQNELGVGYLSGAFGNVDPVAATAWFRQATRHGYPVAFLNLGSSFELGIGSEKNMEKAGALYAEGTRRGNSAATYALARFYEEGLGVDSDLPKALALYRLAHQRGVGDRADLAGKRLEKRLSSAQRLLADQLYQEMITQPEPGSQ